MKNIIEWIVRWMIARYLPEMHLHANPVHKVSDFVAPVPDFTMDGEHLVPSERDQSDRIGAVRNQGEGE